MILAPGQPIPHGQPYRYHPNDHSSPNLPSTSVGPSRKRRRDIGYLADVEVGPKKTRVERVTHPAMPEDIPEPAQDRAVEVTYKTLVDLVHRFHDHTQAIPVHRIQAIEGVQRDQGYRTIGVELAFTALTERVTELERDNRRLRGTTSVENHSSSTLPSTSAGPSRKRRRSPMTFVPALLPVSRALSPVRANLIPSPKRVRDSSYLADVEVIEGVQREQGRRIVGVESAVTALTERVAELERDNRRLRGTASVENQRVDRLQRDMSPEEMEARKAARNLETLNENGDEQEGENGG
nr:hypothetical protein [Tanacetum cinerariifolium]